MRVIQFILIYCFDKGLFSKSAKNRFTKLKNTQRTHFVGIKFGVSMSSFSGELVNWII